MFTNVKLENFLAFTHLEVNLRTKKLETKPLVLLFGENSTGKSSFIKSFSFLKQTMEMLLFNKLFESRINTRFEHKYIPQNFKNLCAEHYHRAESKIMKVSFEMYIKKIMYDYELKIDKEGTIVEEVLIRRHSSKNRIIFKRSLKTYCLGYGMIRGKSKTVLNSLYEEYSNNYSLLSIIYYGIDMNILDAKETLKIVIDYIANMYIKVEGYDCDGRHNYLRDFNLRPQSGVTNRRGRDFLNAGGVILTELLSNIFYDVEKVEYKFTQTTKHLFDYEISVTVSSSKGYFALNYHQLTRSMKQSINLITSYIGRSSGNAIIIDDVAESWSRMVLGRYFLDSIPMNSQSIFTLSTLDIINHVESYAVYFTERDKYNFKITPLDSFKTSRTNHNVRKRYEEGHYINRNDIGKLELYRYDDWFKNELKLIYSEYTKGKVKVQGD